MRLARTHESNTRSQVIKKSLITLISFTHLYSSSYRYDTLWTTKFQQDGGDAAMMLPAAIKQYVRRSTQLTRQGRRHIYNIIHFPV